MIACIIEFGVKDGRDQDRKRLLAFVELEAADPRRKFDDVDVRSRITI